ncbi:hypothetical protein GCM10010376_54220 [Streptomyces violaceusniger]
MPTAAVSRSDPGSGPADGPALSAPVRCHPPVRAQGAGPVQPWSAWCAARLALARHPAQVCSHRTAVAIGDFRSWPATTSTCRERRGTSAQGAPAPVAGRRPDVGRRSGHG